MCCQYHFECEKTEIWLVYPSTHKVTHMTTCTWIVVNEALVDAGQLVSTDVAGSVGWRLKIQIVLALDEKFRCGHIHPYYHFVSEASFLYGCLYQLQG